jgi:hypothetical protein
MAEKGTRAGAIGPDITKLMPAELMQLGQAAVEVQKEISATFEETSRNWGERLKVETDLAQEFTTKLASSKSIPEATQIYQEWLSRRMRLLFDDGQKLMVGSQKLMGSFTRALSSGTQGGGTQPMSADKAGLKT